MVFFLCKLLLSLSVRGPSLDVRIWRRWAKESDVYLTSEDDLRTETVKKIIMDVDPFQIEKKSFGVHGLYKKNSVL